MEKYELVYKIDKNSSHLKLLGERFCKKINYWATSFLIIRNFH